MIACAIRDRLDQQLAELRDEIDRTERRGGRPYRVAKMEYVRATSERFDHCKKHGCLRGMGLSESPLFVDNG